MDGSPDAPPASSDSDTDPPDSVADEERPVLVVRRPPWRARVQWFASQIAVVVAGVLIALVLNAWWAGQQERSREAAYLHQLAFDLAETEQVMGAADTVMVSTEQAIKSLLHSFGNPEVPPMDSVLTWIDLALLAELPHPVLGTAEALVSTGDLALIRDDALRLAIASYLEETRSSAEFYARSSDRLLVDASGLLRAADLSEALARLPPEARDTLSATDPTGLVPPPGWAPPFPLDIEAFYADRDAYTAIQLMAIWLSNMAGARAEFREHAATLREQIEAAR